jgi:hypothetical protein
MHSSHFTFPLNLLEKIDVCDDIDHCYLVIGNSHLGQVGKALLCAFRSQIVHMTAIDLYTGCIMLTHSILEPCCNGSGRTNRCGVYIATATLASGVRDQQQSPAAVWGVRLIDTVAGSLADSVRHRFGVGCFGKVEHPELGKIAIC